MFKKLISVIFTLSILILFAIYAEQANAQRVHLLTMYDSVDKGISAGCKTDVESVTRLLFDWQNKSVASLTTRDRSQGLLAKIHSMPVDPNDVLFFFYAGHGVCDNNKEHFLSIAYTDQLSRKDLRAALLAKKARLTIIVTDCCAEYVGGASPQSVCAPMIGHILQRLFSFSGLVDINSSSFGELAWGVEEWFRDHDSPSASPIKTGEYGLFTRAFCNALLNKDGGYNDWNDFARDLKTNMVSDFRNFKDERRQSLI